MKKIFLKKIVSLTIIFALMFSVASVAFATEASENIDESKWKVVTTHDIFKRYTKYTAYYGNTVLLELRASDGKIEDKTNNVVLTTSNRSETDVGIDYSLNVYGVTTGGRVVKYPHGFQKGDMAVEYGGNRVFEYFKYDSKGFVEGFCYTDGTCIDISDNMYYENYGGISLEQANNTYTYIYDCMSYVYTFENNKLYLGSSARGRYLRDISEISFGLDGYIYAVKGKEKKVIKIPLGSLSIQQVFYPEFKSWITYSGKLQFAVGYIDTGDSPHYFYNYSTSPSVETV